MIKAELRSRNDERSRMVEALADRQHQEMLRKNAEMKQLEEEQQMAAEDAELQSEWDKEEKEAQAEYEAEQNRLESPQELQQFLSEEYGDIWNHAPTRQKMVDEAELAVAAGEPVNDMRTYTKIAEKFRERKKQLESGEIDENAVNREDVFNQLAAMGHREMLAGNKYCEAEPEPETPGETRERFARDNPDFSGEDIVNAAKAVEETHKDQFIKQGYATNEYKIYKQAAEKAERERYLRERDGI